MAGAARSTSSAAAAATFDYNDCAWSVIGSLQRSEIEGKKPQEVDAMVRAKIRGIAEQREVSLSDEQVGIIKGRVLQNSLNALLAVYRLNLAVCSMVLRD